jgi:hypothetical protein
MGGGVPWLASYPIKLFPFGHGVDARDGRRPTAPGALFPGVELGVGTFDRIAER